MYRSQRKSFSKVLILAGLIILGGSFLLAGCATAPEAAKPGISGPKVTVTPESVRLGVAKVTGTPIVFEGSGFQSDDSVFITLHGRDGSEIALADAPIKADGTFRAVANPLGKVTGILRATIGGTYAADGSYNQFVVVTKDPVSAGPYTVRATGMISDQTAETKMLLCEPWGIDLMKDWLGTKVGKIQDKRPR